MAHSLLEGKRFFCREWAFSKINHCLEHRASAKTCGALIMGGPGCGKTALCCEVIWPTCQGRQQSLNKRVLAYHFCQAHDTETLSLTNFIQSLSAQLIKSKLITGYAEKVQDPAIQAVLSTEECKRNPDIAFKKGVLLPLLTLHPPTHNLFCLIDSIDESYLYTVSKTEGTSTTIAELLAAHHHIFPPWLLLVCSARKQSKTVTRLFTGFRKISLDDLRKSHVVRDVQQYILCRLDQEAALRQHLSRETAEMLNQLHIKSNGCFLYLAKVLDGVADNFITLKDIREIPGTLNGLYLWLCQRLFVRKQFVRIQPILNVILAARKPLTPEELYQCVWTKGSNMNFQDFTRDLGILSNILTDGPCGTKILFHHSFAEWLLDVKHCTQKYLCSATDGHGMLAMCYTTRAQKLGPSEVQDFALHLSKIGPQSTLEHYHQVVWLIQSGAPVEASLLPGLPKDDAVTKLLLDAGAHLPTVEDKSAEVEKERRDSIARLLANDSAINELDKHGRTLLCNASYQGNLELVNILIVRKAELETSDKNGQTAMNLSAKQGHTDVTRALIGAGVNVDHADSDGWTPLRSASWSGHVDVVALLLEAGAAVDNPDSDNRTALRAAAWSGHSDIVLLLLQYGANVNIVDNEGRTALIAAAYMGHNGIVSHLLDHGANINHKDCDGRTALSVSALCVPASEGHSAVISHLLDRGAAVDHRDHDGMTPLLVASYEGHHRVCELLLEGDADVDGADKNGRTPLLAAASMGHVEIVDLLLFWCAAVDSIDSDGRTVLSIAAGQGHPIIVQKLLDRGLDDMHRDNAGLTPLHMSAFEGHTQVSEQLLNIGAHVDEVDNDGRHALILASQEGHVQMVASLLDAGANIDRRAHNGKTALRVASLEGHKEVVNLLVGRGCDLNYKDADGRSTIYMLALENSVEIAAFLLENGGDMEAVDLEGRTALHVASWQGHHDFCQLLLRHGAQVNALDNENRSPLQSASWQGHANIVTLLLEHGAIVDHMCNQGATALCISAQEGHEDVVKALLQFGADASRSDLYGRTAMRVAVKGNHASLIAILEQYGASNSGGRASTSSGSSGNSTMGKPPINPCNLIIQGAGTGSPSETPESTMDRRKSSLSNNSSGNLTSSNCSTNQSSGSSGPREEPAVLTFTQQIQQSMSNRNQSKVTNKMLSPVNEPVSPIQSVVSSPRQDQPPTPPHSKIPVKKSISSPPSNGTRPATKKSQRSNSINIITNPTCELQDNDGDYEDDDDDDDIWQPRQSSLKNGNLRKNNSQLKTGIPVSQPKKNSLTKCVETENLQNRLAHFKNNNISGKTSGNPPLLKSPEPRRQRSGIKTNPKFTKVNAVNGYYGNLTSVPVTEKATVSTNGKIVTAAVRPGGLPLKKETPL